LNKKNLYHNFNSLKPCKNEKLCVRLEDTKRQFRVYFFRFRLHISILCCCVKKNSCGGQFFFHFISKLKFESWTNGWRQSNICLETKGRMNSAQFFLKFHVIFFVLFDPFLQFFDGNCLVIYKKRKE